MIVLQVRKEWHEKPVLFYWMMTYQLVGTLMCMFYFYYQQKISDLVGWQVSLVMLISSGLNLIAVYVASQMVKNGIAIEFSDSCCANRFGLVVGVFRNPPLLFFLYIF